MFTRSQVLLVASSFMSPLESRNGTNVNRVRMFGPEKLSQNLKDEKWDVVEIVCTQPFNKNVQYGLSFVKFHSPPDVKDINTMEKTSESKLQFGSFKVKDDSEETPLSLGAFFAKRKETVQDKFSTSPSAIRQAASSFAAATLASNSGESPTSSNSVLGVKRKHSNEENGSPIRTKKKELSTVHINREKVGYKNILGDDSADKTAAATTTKTKLQSPQAIKQTTRDRKTPKKSPKQQIMRNVVFTLSGYQNPERSNIRDFALEMGARYKGDWDSTCTHLICAFTNTPKYNEVRSKGGRIVTKNWIIDCYKKHELLPWRKYMLGKYTKSSTSEEEDDGDDDDDEVRVKKGKIKISVSNNTANGAVNKPPASKALSVTSPKKFLGNMSDDSEGAGNDYGADTDVDLDSGGNTEEEVEKLEKQKKISNSSAVRKVANHKTQVEETKPDTTNLPLPELPDFFKKKIFFLYGDFSKLERHDLKRYITAYNGFIADYMGQDVKYVITHSKWNENFYEVLQDNDNLIFVRPHWIHKCHQSGKLVPYQPHIIVPEK